MVAMANCWTLGTPPTRRGLSAQVEVTDGNRTQHARFRDGRGPTREADAAWLADDGTPLGWQPPPTGAEQHRGHHREYSSWISGAVLAGASLREADAPLARIRPGNPPL